MVNNSGQLLDVAVFRRVELDANDKPKSAFQFWKKPARTEWARVSPIVRINAYAPRNQEAVPYDTRDPADLRTTLPQSEFVLIWSAIRPGVDSVNGCWTEMVSTPSVPLTPTGNSAPLATTVGRRPVKLFQIGRVDQGCCPGHESAQTLEGSAKIVGSCITSQRRAAPTPPPRPPKRPQGPTTSSLPPPPPLLSEQLAAQNLSTIPPPPPLLSDQMARFRQAGGPFRPTTQFLTRIIPIRF